MQKIRPCLWFDNQAEVAVNFYLSVFNGKITDRKLWGESGPGPKGSVLSIEFELEGQQFMALNGGPEYKFTPAISLSVDCKNQNEIDAYWDKLTDGGEEMACGWVADKFGVCWQILPTGLNKLLFSDDEGKSQQAINAMFAMKKLDIAVLEKAYNQ